MQGNEQARHPHFKQLLEAAAPLPPVPTAVVAPESENSLGGAVLAARHTLIDPILIGAPAKIAAAADQIGADISGFEIVEEANHRAAAALAVKLVHEGRASTIMKGSLHTDELLGPIVKRETGLRTGRRLSHAFVLDIPGHSELLVITDGAINIAPDLETKASITQNAIDLAPAIGIDDPRVAVVSAVETVNDKIPATLDAAVLSKMADRGQIKRGKVDGPLAMDNAINMAAAKTKGITSDVAGQANILVVPSIETGNMLVKGLTFLAGAQTGGIVLGAKCPVILTSRADDDDARLASCVMAMLLANQTS